MKYNVSHYLSRIQRHEVTRETRLSYHCNALCQHLWHQKTRFYCADVTLRDVPR